MRGRPDRPSPPPDHWNSPEFAHFVILHKCSDRSSLSPLLCLCPCFTRSRVDGAREPPRRRPHAFPASKSAPPVCTNWTVISLSTGTSAPATYISKSRASTPTFYIPPACPPVSAPTISASTV